MSQVPLQSGADNNVLANLSKVLVGGLGRWADVEIAALEQRYSRQPQTVQRGETEPLKDNQRNEQTVLDEAMKMSKLQLVGSAIVVTALVVALIRS